MPCTREQRLVRIDAFCAVQHTVFDEAYHLKLWYRLNDNPMVQERLDREDAILFDQYHADLERDVMHDDLQSTWDMIDADGDDCDVETCVMCGRGYGPHAKEKTWVRSYAGAILPQRCFRCWDI